MKLILCLTLIWALSSTAAALQCITCTDLQCSTTTPFPCSSETMCITASIQASTSGITVQQTIKACAPSFLCPATGAQTFSIDLGSTAAVASAQCCNTDNCNSATLALPGAQTDNSLQCCNTTDCSTSIQCQGVENSCFKTSVTIGSSTTAYLGCASNNLCAATANLTSLPLLSSIGNFTTPTCCQTNLCNAAGNTWRLSLAVIHLLLGLFFSTLS